MTLHRNLAVIVLVLLAGCAQMSESDRAMVQDAKDSAARAAASAAAAQQSAAQAAAAAQAASQRADRVYRQSNTK